MNEDEDSDAARKEIAPIPDRARAGIVLLLVFLAIAHVLFPTLAIDTTFLGLLALAAIVALFDVERIEWLGIKARRIRRELRSAEVALEGAGEPEVSLKPTLPSGQKADTEEEDAAPHAPSDEAFSGLAEMPGEPVASVLWITEQLRIELILLAGNAGMHIGRQGWRRHTALQVARELVEKKRLAPGHYAAIRKVLELRNLVAHGQRISGELLHETALLAVKTIQSLRELPREYYRVRGESVPLFKDQGLSVPHEAIGIVIAHINNEGKVLTTGAYPQGIECSRGDFVTWDWDMSQVFHTEAWYTEPVTGEVKMAFSEAATFVGRPYPDEWSVVSRFSNPDVGLDD